MFWFTDNCADASRRYVMPALYPDIIWYGILSSVSTRTVEHRALRLFGGSAWRSHGAADQDRAADLGTITLT